MNFEELFYDFLIEAETGAEVDRLISEINDELSSAEDRVLGRLKKGGNGMNPYIEVMKCSICKRNADAINKKFQPRCSKHGDTIVKVKVFTHWR